MRHIPLGQSPPSSQKPIHRLLRPFPSLVRAFHPTCNPSKCSQTDTQAQSKPLNDLKWKSQSLHSFVQVFGIYTFFGALYSLECFTINLSDSNRPPLPSLYHCTFHDHTNTFHETSVVHPSRVHRGFYHRYLKVNLLLSGSQSKDLL